MAEVRVVVDAMGGDVERQVVLDGIAAALEADPALTVVVAGTDEVVTPFCEGRDRAEALVAPQVITMEDDPIKAVMTKRKSSIVLGCRAVKRGEAQGFFSAGSTGAITAAGTAYVTPLKYVAEDGTKHSIRPGITSVVPNRAGGETVLCDMGANPDVEPMDVVRFAQMAATYATVVCGIEHPRVGLLSNGTEDEKGSNFTKECFPLMKEQVPGFVGNCEGTDLTSGNIDVVACDGMSGNIALKATEGACKMLMIEISNLLHSSTKDKIAGMLVKKDIYALKDKFSGDSRGGAILLGLRGVVLKGHGSTSVEAIKNGTLATVEAVRGNLVQRIADSMPNVVY